MRREVRWDRMFPDELNAALVECPLVYMPYGLCEPHGPQSALGMDLLRPQGAAIAAAQQGGGIVAPPHYWHIHELGVCGAWAEVTVGQARPWVTAVPPWMFFKNMLYHIRTMDMLEFHAAIVFSGHAGPHCPDFKTFTEILQPHFAMRLALIFDYDVIPEEFMADFCHGGSVETAYLWAVAPECVDLSRLLAEDAPGPHFAMGANARETDRRRGERIVAGIAANLVTKGQELLAEYDRVQPQRKPLTFDEVEQLWEDEVRPRFGDFRAMLDLAEGGSQQPPAKDSRWRANWKVPKRS